VRDARPCNARRALQSPSHASSANRTHVHDCTHPAACGPAMGPATTRTPRHPKASPGKRPGTRHASRVQPSSTDRRRRLMCRFRSTHRKSGEQAVVGRARADGGHVEDTPWDGGRVERVGVVVMPQISRAGAVCGARHDLAAFALLDGTVVHVGVVPGQERARSQDQLSIKLREQGWSLGVDARRQTAGSRR
jgi:hypothetical protein